MANRVVGVTRRGAFASPDQCEVAVNVHLNGSDLSLQSLMTATAESGDSDPMALTSSDWSFSGRRKAPVGDLPDSNEQVVSSRFILMTASNSPDGAPIHSNQEQLRVRR